MTTTLKSRPSANGSRTRTARAAASSAPRTPVRRRWARLGAGLAAALLGAWIFAAMYLSAGDQTDVLVLAADVDRFQAIERSDLRVARVSESSDVDTVSSDRIDEFVGRVAGVDLVSGSLLTGAQVLAAGEELVANGEAVVGVLVGPADAPQGSLRRGTPVTVVVRPVIGSTEPPAEIGGWVWDASAEASSTREVAVEVVVRAGQSGLVSAAAADRRVSIVVLAG
jgi:SAF domain-containing protein